MTIAKGHRYDQLARDWRAMKPEARAALARALTLNADFVALARKIVGSSTRGAKRKISAKERAARSARLAYARTKRWPNKSRDAHLTRLSAKRAAVKHTSEWIHSAELKSKIVPPILYIYDDDDSMQMEALCETTAEYNSIVDAPQRAGLRDLLDVYQTVAFWTITTGEKPYGFWTERTVKPTRIVVEEDAEKALKYARGQQYYDAAGIFIKPLPDRKGLYHGYMIDDIRTTTGKVDGAALVVETSPGKYQAHFRTDRGMTEDELRAVIGVEIIDRHGDPGAKAFNQARRAPGFTNTKRTKDGRYKYADSRGRCPFVRIVSKDQKAVQRVDALLDRARFPGTAQQVAAAQNFSTNARGVAGKSVPDTVDRRLPSGNRGGVEPKRENYPDSNYSNRAGADYAYALALANYGLHAGNIAERLRENTRDKNPERTARRAYETVCARKSSFGTATNE